MKKRKISFLLTALLSAAVFLITGCAGIGNGGGGEPLLPPEVLRQPPVQRLEAQPTDYYMVENGQCGYTVVYPSSNTGKAVAAADEFTHFFRQATGISLSVMSDSNLTYTENVRYISIGKTTLLNQADLSADIEDITGSGYMIKTKGLSVFLAGGLYGDVYAVYTFLALQFGFEVYAADEIYIDTNVSSCKLLNFNVLDIPAIDSNVASYGMGNNIAKQRMRFVSGSDVFMPVEGRLWHTFTAFISDEEYIKDYPQWFSEPGALGLRQLKLDFTSDFQQQLIIEKMKEVILANPNFDYVTFTQEDHAWGATDYTESLKETYGAAANAAEYIQYTNIIAREIKQWLNTEHGGREVKIVIYGYGDTREAPVKKDADGNWVAIDSSVVPEDNIVVWLVEGGAGHFSPDDEKKGVTEDIFQKWNALCDEMLVWSNRGHTYFMYYWMPFYGINGLQANYQFFYENGVNLTYLLAQWNQEVPMDWGKLKIYLGYKLAWNPYQDVEVLIDNFMDNYFKDAAKPMREFFQHYRLWLAYKENVLGAKEYFPDSLERTPTSDPVFNRKYWPQNVLWHWLGKVDEAYAAIEKYKTSDPQLYKKLHDRINIESVSVRMLEYIVYSVDYPLARRTDMLDSLKADVYTLGITHYSEMVTFANYFGL